MNKTLQTLARRLRRDQTNAERVLWRHLRARQMHGAKFRRQHPIGQYITDFCCLERKLVVELDGGQHAVWVPRDQRRTAFLAQKGYRVLRVWNREVLSDPKAVVQHIAATVSDPHPTPLPGTRRAGESGPYRATPPPGTQRVGDRAREKGGSR